MEFNNTPPKWDEQGAEPTEELQTKGFQAGYKPPAPYFNYLFNKITTCLKEIQEKLKGHAEDTSNPHKVTKAQVGLGNADNTADADKIVKYATSADTATKATQDGNGKEISKTYLPLAGGTVSGTTKINNITTIKTTKNGSCPVYFKMFDVTDWYLNGSRQKWGFNGFLYSYRNGYMVEHITEIIMDVSYQKTTSIADGDGFLTLTTTNNTYRPCIIHDTTNNKYYLSLRVDGGNRDLIFQGIFTNTYSFEQIETTDAAGTLPDNYEIIISYTKCINKKPAKASIYGDTVVSMGRAADTTIGDYSFAFGKYETASGDYSCSFGEANIASGDYSLAFGDNTNATGNYSKAFGSFVEASGKFSSVHGEGVKASGIYSHAKGYGTTASGSYSSAEGYMTTASGGNGSHAEGMNTTASGDYTHAEGYNTVASNTASHAEGRATTANGDYSHAEGFKTTALTNQHAQGHYNNTTNATANSTSGTSTGTAFVIGNGSSSDNTSNAFRVTGEGATVAKKAYSTTGADYAEFREWLDGNEDNEDRRGYFVTLVGKKIRKANAGEYIRGVVSALPSVIGNYDEEWMGRYIRDDFGAFITETFEYEDEVITGYTEDGEPIIETATKTGTKWKENPEYDKEKEYIPREERKEWDAVGMVGELSVRDDGTCKVNGYCKCADGGIATNAEVSEYSYLTPIYRVVDRVTENIVKIEI